MNWEKVRLGEVCEKVRSVSPADKYGDDSFIYLDIGSVISETKEVLTGNRVIGKSAPSRARQLVVPGDVLVSTVRPNLNAVAIIPETLSEAIGSTGFCVLRPNRKLIGRYLFYWVRSKDFIANMVKQATGASYPAVSDTIIKSSSIPLPPPSVQRQIAAVLDAADVVRQKDKALLSRYDALLQSIFHQLFGDPVQNEKGWEVKKLGEVVIVNPRLSSIEKELSPDVPVSFIPMAAVSDTDGCVIELAERPLGEVQKGFTFFGNEDVIFAKITPCMENGKAAIVRELRNGFGFGSTEFHVLRCGTELLPEYLFSIIRRKEFRDAAARNMTGSAGQKRVPTDYVKRLEIPIPPLSLQSQFSGMAQNIQRQKALVKQQAAQSEALFQSLLHRSFQSS